MEQEQGFFPLYGNRDVPSLWQLLPGPGTSADFFLAVETSMAGSIFWRWCNHEIKHGIGGVWNHQPSLGIMGI